MITKLQVKTLNRNLALLTILIVPLLSNSQVKGEGKWNTYQDPGFGFSLQYPTIGWEIKTLLEDQHRDEFAMRRYVAFAGPGHSLIGIGIWDNESGLALSEWFGQHHSPLSEESQTLSTSDTRVAGNQAILLLQPGDANAPTTLHTIFQCDEQVFRIEYYAYDGGTAQETYLRMLASFQCAHQPSSASQLPPLPLMASSEAWPEETWCCGNYDSCNPYPCCNNQGNCTWWAKYKRPDFPCMVSWGNAGPTWITRAREWGFPTGTTPMRGAVAVVPGHVAYVKEVYANGTYRVSQMGWCRTCGEEVNMSGGEFIYCKCCCCPGLGLDSGASNGGYCSSEADLDTEDSTSQFTTKPNENIPESDPTVTPEPIALSDLDERHEPDAALMRSIETQTIEPQRTPPASISYRIAKSVFGSGGGLKESTHYVMNSTQGQSTDLTRRTSDSYVLMPGYWSSAATGNYKVYLPLVVKNP